MKTERSPGFKLFLVGIIGLILTIPLMLVYWLSYDRQQQSETAQASISSGWGGPQTIIGPVLVIPYESTNEETVSQNGKDLVRTVKVMKELYLSPETNNIITKLKPKRLKKSIYESVLFDAENKGTAKFALPADFDSYGIARDALKLGSAELRFGVSDARGLQADSVVTVNGQNLQLQPGKGLNASQGSGFFTFVSWDAVQPMNVSYKYSIRGNKKLTMIPRGGETKWSVESSWPNPSFEGDFLPTDRSVKASGFTSSHKISNLALGQSLILTEDPRAPSNYTDEYGMSKSVPRAEGSTASQYAAIGLVEPVDLYSQVDRSIKYGFLFIGFTFLAFLMFDLVAGARVAAAEYLMTGAGLILFFVLLLAFAEVVGFMIAYLIAAGAIAGLLTAYSAAVLRSWLRAKMIGGLLVSLYATLYVLLNLEAYSLIIGSLLLFVALAVVMWATRAIDWSPRGEVSDSLPEPQRPSAAVKS
jgi:inner membrane protein